MACPIYNGTLESCLIKYELENCCPCCLIHETDYFICLFCTKITCAFFTSETLEKLLEVKFFLIQKTTLSSTFLSDYGLGTVVNRTCNTATVPLIC